MKLTPLDIHHKEFRRSLLRELDFSREERNLQQFAAMYRYKNRDNVPDHCVHLWSQLVHHQLQRFASAPKEKKEEERRSGKLEFGEQKLDEDRGHTPEDGDVTSGPRRERQVEEKVKKEEEAAKQKEAQEAVKQEAKEGGQRESAGQEGGRGGCPEGKGGCEKGGGKKVK